MAEDITRASVEEAALEVSPSEAQQAPLRPIPRMDRGPFHGLWALTHRDLRKWYSNRIQLVIALIQPIIWMGVFGKALNFGSFITSSGASAATASQVLLATFGTTSYFSYLACGQFASIVLFTSAFSGMSVVFDRRFGFMNKALSTPVGRGTIVLSKIFQSIGRSMVQSVIILAIAIVLGLDTAHLSVPGIAGAFTVVFFMGMGLSALYTLLALRSSDWQTQMAIINLLNLPLVFASNSILPVKIMPQWLQYVVRVNPVSYANDAIRQLLIGAIGLNSLPVDFAVLVGFGLTLSAAGIVLSWRLLSK